MRNDRSRAALESAVGGIVATGAMTAAMAALNQLLPEPEERALPPRKVAVGMAAKAGVAHQMSRPERSAFTWLSHFGFGVGAASLYPYVGRHIPAPPAWRGVVYGLGVWAASYAGWVPALGILPPPQHRPWRHNVLIIAAHVVWGAVLGSLAPDRAERMGQGEDRAEVERPDGEEGRSFLRQAGLSL